MAGLDPTRQLVYGCLGVALAGMFALYCAGTLSLLIRPMLFDLSPSPAPMDAPVTAIPTPTSSAVLLPLPSRIVPNTPTQGPIPTREPATTTPTSNPFATPSVTGTAINGTPRGSVTATVRASATPTRR